MSEETKELEKKEEQALTTTNGNGKRGFEEPTGKEDLLMPRAKLLQALSPEIVDNLGDFHVGMIINSLNLDILPEEFIPVFKFTNWIRFNPRSSDHPDFNPNYGAGDIIWQCNDPYDKRVIEEGQFGPEGQRPLATKFLNFFSYFPGVSMPIIVSFSSTSYKSGKRLYSLAKFSGKDMFAMKYSLKCKQEKKDVGTYFILVVEPLGDALKEDYVIGEKLWTDFHDKSKDIQVHDEKETDGEAEKGEERPF